jgi:hypothetical protein
MDRLDRILGVVALAMSLLVLAGVLSTDAYSRAAQAEARGYDAMTHLIVDDTCSLCLDDAAPVAVIANAGLVEAQ